MTHQDKPEHYPGNTKAAADPAPYPPNWTAEQRVSAYWYALRLHVVPHTTTSWDALAAQMRSARKTRPHPTLDDEPPPT